MRDVVHGMWVDTILSEQSQTEMLLFDSVSMVSDIECLPKSLPIIHGLCIGLA